MLQRSSYAGQHKIYSLANYWLNPKVDRPVAHVQSITKVTLERKKNPLERFMYFGI